MAAPSFSSHNNCQLGLSLVYLLLFPEGYKLAVTHIAQLTPYVNAGFLSATGGSKRMECLVCISPGDKGSFDVLCFHKTCPALSCLNWTLRSTSSRRRRKMKTEGRRSSSLPQIVIPQKKVVLHSNGLSSLYSSFMNILIISIFLHTVMPRLESLSNKSTPICFLTCSVKVTWYTYCPPWKEISVKESSELKNLKG